MVEVWVCRFCLGRIELSLERITVDDVVWSGKISWLHRM